MLAYIFVALIIAVGVFILWKSWTIDGFNWWQGIGALAALLAGALVLVADWLKTLAQ